MRSRKVAVWVAALGIALALHGCEPEGGRAPDNPRVLVIGLEGVRPDALTEASTPNLDALVAEGVYSERGVTGRPTLKGPAWASMLTGVWPEKHGITGDDLTGNHLDQFPDFLTRVESVRPELSTFVAADWPPLVTAVDGGPLVGDAPDEKVALDGDELGWARADSMVVDAAVERLREGHPHALFVYLGSPGEVAGEAGALDEGYVAAVARADEEVGRLVDALHARPAYGSEDWLVIVSTGYGLRPDGGHGGDSMSERTIFYLVSGPSAAEALPALGAPRIVDVAVTALAHLGIAPDPSWSLDGRPTGLRQAPVTASPSPGGG